MTFHLFRFNPCLTGIYSVTMLIFIVSQICSMF
nr:MAG TPA: hypothetical protein [Caudoviricetes sp.]